MARKGKHELTVKQRERLERLQAKAQELLKDSSVKRIVWRRLRGIRAPFAYVKFQMGARACRDRSGKDKAICGDVWELATYRVDNDKMINARCFINGHMKPRVRTRKG